MLMVLLPGNSLHKIFLKLSKRQPCSELEPNREEDGKHAEKELRGAACDNKPLE